MNRALRREAQQQQRRVLARAQAVNDPTVPLVYKAGYEHILCGGEVERPNKVGLGAYCARCDRHVPMQETRRTNTSA